MPNYIDMNKLSKCIHIAEVRSLWVETGVNFIIFPPIVSTPGVPHVEYWWWGGKEYPIGKGVTFLPDRQGGSAGDRRGAPKSRC